MRIGILSFGGGNTGIPLLEAEAVPHIVSREEFAELVGVNFAFPGVSIVKLAAMVGLRAAGIPGLLAMVTGLVLPGLLLTAIAYGLLSRNREHPVVQKLLTASQYAAAALLAAAALHVLPAISGPRRQVVTGLFLATGVFAAVYLFRLSPALAVVIAALVGLFLF